MKSNSFRLYYLLTCLSVLVASYYPLSMGVRVVSDMLTKGSVLQQDYPKYIIPYTPISLALLLGLLCMPLCFRWFKRFAPLGGAIASLSAFFTFELLLEKLVVVLGPQGGTYPNSTTLENWQMYSCMFTPEQITPLREKTAVEILIGDYSPAFKLHFYVISVVIILSVLNCLYGFGHIVRTGDKKRQHSLVLQSACSAVFLGLCILACFTAFWRDGSLQISPLSASLMTAFFILFGVTAGTFTGSFLLQKPRPLSVFLPSAIAAGMTLLMYIGEMILLNGQLYQFGNNIIFESLPIIVLSPADIMTILISGAVTALLFTLLNRKRAT